jgi:hypothetical protein
MKIDEAFGGLSGEVRSLGIDPRRHDTSPHLPLPNGIVQLMCALNIWWKLPQSEPCISAVSRVYCRTRPNPAKSASSGWWGSAMSRTSAVLAERWLAETRWEERGSGLVTPVSAVDFAAPTFDVIDVRDPSELEDLSSPESSPPFNYSGVWRYQLQDRGLLRVSFDRPITSITERRLGRMMISYASDRFATAGRHRRRWDRCLLLYCDVPRPCEFDAAQQRNNQ